MNEKKKKAYEEHSRFLEGTGLKVGDFIDTDLIIPGRYLRTADLQNLAEHVLEGLGTDFSFKVRGRIIVAGKNFGCGSSREQAALALKFANVPCVIAESFARIFFRNAINVGLPVLECPDTGRIRDGDLLRVDVLEGVIKNISKNQTYNAFKFPDFILEILERGGLLNYYKEEGNGH